MTDGQRTDMVGCYGHPDMKTPHLDRLAKAGVRFDRAYTCQPVCGPARSALFTGTWPHLNGSWGNSMPLGPNVKTLGQRLRDAGVPAAYIGKWHLDASDYFGTARCPDGWDPAYWYDMRCYLEELSPEDRARSRQAKTMHEPGMSAEFTFGHRCTDRAVDYLAKHSADDFCLVVSYDEPHDPYLCPEPYASMYRDYEFPKSPNVRDRLTNKPAHQHAWAGDATQRDRESLKIKPADMLGCNSFIDSEIGRVIDAIDRHAPGALVIYTSDHGVMLDSHCLTGKGPVAYDEITRIPLIVRWPGHSPAGGTGPHPVSHIDLTPTILDYFGQPTPKTIDGRSMLTSFSSPQTRAIDAVFIEFARYEIDHDGFGGFQPMRAAFDGRYKLVINLLTEDELYDLQADPGEIDNLINAPDHAVGRNALHDKLLDWMNQTRDPFRGYYWERRPWRTDARPATWNYTSMTRQREGECDGEPRQLDYSTGLEMKEATRKK